MNWLFNLLKKLYNSLRKFFMIHVKETLDESLTTSTWDFDMLIGQLQKLVREHHHLLSTNSELENRMLNKKNETEELNMRCDTF